MLINKIKRWFKRKYKINETERFYKDIDGITSLRDQVNETGIHNDYFNGVYNGLEMALSILEQRDANYKDFTNGKNR